MGETNSGNSGVGITDWGEAAKGANAGTAVTREATEGVGNEVSSISFGDCSGKPISC